MVDGSGRRFVDEAQNGNDLGRALLNFEPQSFSYPHVPAWPSSTAAIAAPTRSAPSRRTRPTRTGWRGRAPSPRWPRRSACPAELEATVDRFNEGAARGEDPEHGRGSTAYDRFIGGLGPVDEAPYYALRVLPGCLGTKGGPRTDAHGRVLDRRRRAHPRLYAAGTPPRARSASPTPGRGDARAGARLRRAGWSRRRGGRMSGRAPIEVMPLGDVLVRAARRWPESIAVGSPTGG